MCRKITEGGRRCPCAHGEKRRGYERASRAAKRASTIDNNSYHLSEKTLQALPENGMLTDEQTIGGVPKNLLNEAQQVFVSYSFEDYDAGIPANSDKGKQLLARSEELGEQPWAVDGERVVILYSDEEKEKMVRQVGQYVHVRAEEIAGVKVEELEQAWVERKNVAEKRIEIFNKERDNVMEEYMKINKDDTLDLKAKIEARKRVDEKWNIMLTDPQHKEDLKVFAGEDEQTLAQLTKLSEGYQKALAEIRPLGGDILTNDDSAKLANKVLGEVAEYYPTTWIEKSNKVGNLKAKSTKGRAHYSQAKGQKKQVPYFTVSIHGEHISENDRKYLETSGYEPLPSGTTEFLGQKLPYESQYPETVIWVRRYYNTRKHPQWYSGKDVEGKPPRGYSEAYDTLNDGTKVKVWRRPKTRAKTSEVVAEITVDKSSYGQHSDKPGLGCGIHEMAHRFQHIKPALGHLEEQFLVRRTTNADGTREKLLPYQGSRTERVYSDNFTEPYIGKTYKDKTYHEILSMGTESMFTGTQHGLLALGKNAESGGDKEMRDFILGILAVV